MWSRSSSMMRRLLLSAVCLMAVYLAATGGAEALTDVKRRAAAELMKEGKVAEAIGLISEVIKAEPENYRDHLLLARAYDRLNKGEMAAESYRRVLELPGGNEDRAAKAEVDRRLKVLDARTAKVQVAEDEFLKKLDGFEREAVAAKDMGAIYRVFALRGGLWNARGRKEGFGVDLPATAEWLDGGGVVYKGVKYRVRVAGFWTLDGVRCTADGTDERPATAHGPYGCVAASVIGGPRYERFTTDSTFVAPATGRLVFISNTATKPERDNSSGRVYLLVQAVSGDNRD
jgi:hypothetical protein